MVFGSEFAHIGRFKDMPQDDPNCVIDDSEKNNIMHVSLPIGNSILMGSDAGGGWTCKFLNFYQKFWICRQNKICNCFGL